MTGVYWFSTALLVSSSQFLAFLLVLLVLRGARLLVLPLWLAKQAQDVGQNGTAHQTHAWYNHEIGISLKLGIVATDCEDDHRQRTQSEHEQIEGMHAPCHFLELLHHGRFSFRAE